MLAAVFFTTCQTVFSEVPSPHGLPARQTHRKRGPLSMPASINHRSRVSFTQLGTGTVRMCLPLPIRSTIRLLRAGVLLQRHLSGHGPMGRVGLRPHWGGHRFTEGGGGSYRGGGGAAANRSSFARGGTPARGNTAAPSSGGAHPSAGHVQAVRTSAPRSTASRAPASRAAQLRTAVAAADMKMANINL